MKKVTVLISVFYLLLLIPCDSFASWRNSEVVLESTWGDEPGEFGIEYQDSFDEFPKIIGVDKQGAILVADGVNKRVQIMINGTLSKTINKPSGLNVRLWPRSLLVSSGGQSFLANLNIYDYSGGLIKKVNIKRSKRFSIGDGYIIKNLENNTYFKYSPTGELLQTYTSEPIELGRYVSNERQPDGSRKIVIEFDDITYGINAPQSFEYFSRDNKGYLNAAVITGEAGSRHFRVYKYDRCGKEIASVDLPVDNIISEPADSTRPSPVFEEVVEEYGKPVIGPNGDVYTWKRTPDTYSILKWTWVDEPTDPKSGDCDKK